MQRTESVEYIKQNLILHIKGIVIKWTYEKLLSGFLSLMSSASSCIYFLNDNRNIFARRGTNLTFIQQLLYNFVSRSDSNKILCAQTGNKKWNENFSKTLIFELISLFLLQFKKKLNGKILDLSIFFIFIFFVYSYLLRSVALVSFRRGTKNHGMAQLLSYESFLCS